MSNINDEQKKARKLSLKSLKSAKGQVFSLHVVHADNVAEEVVTLKTKGRGKNYALTTSSNAQINKRLLKEASSLNSELKLLNEQTTKKVIEQNAGLYNKYNRKFLLTYTDLDPEELEKVYQKINADLLSLQIEKVYSDGLTISKRIWKAASKFRTSIKNVILEGIRKNRDIVEISKDIKVYVRTNKQTLAKRYANVDSSKQYKGESDADYKQRIKTFKNRIPKEVEYNALRIVRTQMQGAIQDSNIMASDYTPSVQSFNWNLSAAHKVYSICEDIAANNPWTAETFWYRRPPHPNCLSYVTFNEISNAKFVSNLKSWSKNPSSPDCEYLNDWKNKYYTPVEMGQKENYFSSFVKVANDQAA